MMHTLSGRPSAITLSEFLLENMDRILVEWDNFAQSIPSAADLGKTELRNDAEKILRTIALQMQAHQSPREQEAKGKGMAVRVVGANETSAESHGELRLRSGFSLTEMVSEYRALRAAVIRLWTLDWPRMDVDALHDLTRFNEGIDQALTESIARHTALIERSRELFLGMLGHDMRTPLSVLFMSAQILRGSKNLTEDQTAVVLRMLRSGSRLKGLVSDLFYMTQARLGGALPIEREPMDLGAMCREVVDEMRGIGIDRPIDLDLAGDLTGRWDPARIRQVFANLLQNAFQHGAEATPIDATVSGHEKEVMLTIRNQGPPIPESVRKHIFEPLVRGDREAHATSSNNLGLGLYIANEIAAGHGGSIDVTSSKEEGTSFTVRLPRQ